MNPRETTSLEGERRMSYRGGISDNNSNNNNSLPSPGPRGREEELIVLLCSRLISEGTDRPRGGINSNT